MIALRAEVAYLGRALRQPLLWLLIILTAVVATAAYQVRRPIALDIGTAGDLPYLHNFHEIRSESNGRTYRASDAYGYVVLPALGGGVPISLTLSLNAGRAGGPVTILINGTQLLDRSLPAGWHSYHFALDAAHPAALAARDLVIEIRTPPGQGVLLDRVDVGAPGPGFVVPALSEVAAILVIVALAYLTLSRLLATAVFAARRRTGSLSSAGALLVGSGLVAGLALIRPATTTTTPALLLLSVILYALVAGAGPLLRALWPELRLIGHLAARPALSALLGLTVLGLSAAYQVRHTYHLDLGSPSDQAYVVNFQDRDGERGGPTFRPSGTYSYINLPGVGGGVPYTLSVTLKPARNGLPITLLLNGDTLFQQAISGTWQTQAFTIDTRYPHALAARDAVLELRTPAVRSVAVDAVDVGAQGPGFVVPALNQLAGLTGLVLLVYLLLGRALTSQPTAGRVASGGAALVGLSLVGTLAAVHLPLTVTTGHLVLTAGLSYALLVISEAGLRRIVPAAGNEARWAAAIFALAFAVRFGGMALPQSVIIDMPYHLKWIHELLAGNLTALTDPHGGLNQPPREWGLAVIIPKSPLFYFVATPLALLPGSLDTAIKGFVCLLDAGTALICYGLLARYERVGGGRAGLGAAVVYATTPLTFRALAYGILPTILAQWLSLAAFVAVIAGPWAGEPGAGTRQARLPQHVLRFTFYVFFILLLAAALVAFPTIAVFDTWVIGGVALTRLVRRRLWAGLGLLGSLAGAWVVAIAVYYGPYISDLINHTLPQMLGPRPAGAAATPGGSTVHWSGPLDLLGWTAGYLVSLLPLLLGLTGLALLRLDGRRAAGGGADTEAPIQRATRNAQRATLSTLLAWWVAILPIFVVVNYRVDMIGKHLFYTMVPLALGSGIVLAALWQRGGWARWAAGLLSSTLAWTALVFWIERLVRASS